MKRTNYSPQHQRGETRRVRAREIPVAAKPLAVRPLLRAAVLSLAGGLFAATAVPARAQQTYFWTGGGGSNSNWGNTANWNRNGNVVPIPDSSTSLVSFVTGVAGTIATLDFDRTAYGITFGYNASNTATSFTISGTGSTNALNLYAGGITNNTSLTQTISALVSLRASQTFTTVAGGTLQFIAAPNSQLNLNGNVLTIDGAGTTDLQSSIGGSGGGNLIKSGSGTLTLTGTNTYTGTTTLNGGVLNVGTSSVNSSLGNGTGAVTINGGRLAFGNTSSAGSAAFNNKAGGNVQFYDASTAGTATITNNGQLDFLSASTANNASVINNAGGVLDLSLHTDGLAIGSLSGAGSVFLGGNLLTIGGKNTNTTISGVLQDGGYAGGTGGGLVKTGTGALTLTGANTYTGGTTVNGGLLNVGTDIISSSLGTGNVTIGSDGILAYGASSSAGNTTITNSGILRFWNTTTANTASVVSNSGGVVDISTHNGGIAIGSLSGSGIVFLGGNALTLGGKNTDDTISGVLQNGGYLGGAGGSLIKTGTGILTLTGANTYTGSTTISAGALHAGFANVLGTGAVTNNGTLLFLDTASGTFTNAITGSGAVYLQGNTLNLSGANTFTGGLTLKGGATVTLTANQSAGAGAVTVVGDRGGDSTNSAGGTTGDTTTLSANAAALSSVTALTLQGGDGGNSSLHRGGKGGTAVISPAAQDSLANLRSLTLIGGKGGGGSPVTSGGLGGDATFKASTPGILANLTALTLAGGNGTDGSVGNTAGVGGTATFTVSASGVPANLTTLNLTGGKGGNVTLNLNNTGGIGGSGGDAVFTVSTSGMLTNLPTLTITGGNGGQVIRTDIFTIGSGTGGTGGTAIFSLGVSDTNAANKTNVIFARGAANQGTAGRALLSLNGYSLTLGGIETVGGAVDSNAIIQGVDDGVSTLTVGGDNANHTFGGTLQEGTGVASLNLIKTGTGTLTLLGTNTYRGGTTINAGTLLVNSEAALGNGGFSALTLDGGTFGFVSGNRTLTNNFSLGGVGSGFTVVNASDVLTVSGTLAGSGSLTKSGAGTLTLTGTNTYSGGTIINAGAVTAMSTASLGSGSVNNNSQLIFNISDNETFSNTISGSGSLTKSGAGTLTLTGTNTYSGGTTINAGTVIANSSAPLGSGPLTNNSQLIFDISDDGTFSGPISGSGKVTKMGIGNQTLSGSNTYTGGTTIQSGLLSAGSDTALGTGRITLNGATLQASGTARTLTNAVTLAGSSGLSSGTVTTGGSKVPGLTLAGPVTLGGDGGLSIAGNTRVAITGVVGEDTVPRVFIKDGVGTLVLTNDNTYTGGTLIRSGTLVVNNAYNRTALGSGTGEGAVTVGKGATLTGTFVISGPVQVNNGGILGVGNSIGHSSVNRLTLAGGSSLDFEIGDDGFSSDRLDIASLLTKSGSGAVTFLLSGEHLADGTQKGLSEGTFTLLGFGSESGFRASDFVAAGLSPDWTYAFHLTESGGLNQPGSLSVTLHQISGAAAPEPGSLMLLLLGGSGSGGVVLMRVCRCRASGNTQ